MQSHLIVHYSVVCEKYEFFLRDNTHVVTAKSVCYLQMIENPLENINVDDKVWF